MEFHSFQINELDISLDNLMKIDDLCLDNLMKIDDLCLDYLMIAIMRRIILDILKDWKASKNHKVLMLRGARQVGKTYVSRELGEPFNIFWK